MSQALTRRTLLKTAAAGAANAALSRRAAAQASRRVVIVGGGFGGATCARELKRKGLAVTLVEASPVYTACPFSNAVLAGLRPIDAQQFMLDAVEKGGIDIVRQKATRVDPQARRVSLEAMTRRQPRPYRMHGRQASRLSSCVANSRPWMTAVHSSWWRLPIHSAAHQGHTSGQA
jgi:NADPH-dependent 2,4-dienoyl-CoA reductase/sulfur reductase-like enzyme